MKNNKGFSLVELIIVIAIMAVLIGVLAPQYLRYVEKSRITTDETAVSEVENALEGIMAEYADQIGSDSFTVDVSVNGGITCGLSTIQDQLRLSINGATNNGEIDLVSTKYKASTYTISVSYNDATYTWTTDGSWH